MQVYVPTNKDYLEINNNIVCLEKLRNMFIDLEKGKIDYEVWIETAEISKIPGPFLNRAVIYTSKHEINQECYVVLLSMQHILKSHRVKCFVKSSVYHPQKHKYSVSFTVFYKKEKMLDNFIRGAYSEFRPISLDLD